MLEKDIKIEILRYLYKSEKHSVLVPEVTVSNRYGNRYEKFVRADILALNGDISIYEIKSEKDTLARLPHQISKYMEYANKVSVVVDEKFLKKLSLPDEVGVFVVSGKKMEKLKSPTQKEISKDSYLRYWWGIEFKKAFKGFQNVCYDSIIKAENSIKAEFSLEEIKAFTLFRLKERYLSESELIKKLVEQKKYNELFPKRIIEKKLQVTPISQMPYGIVKGVL
ncbi:sce7726 family protein [Campylobacter mucosalis]|uniref:Sce7726 family protein n=1 Tax=Campylobacter mucosalis CCUG 21559 TaxID=1032067 RepID=A0A6G5QHF6_9BACT|nr:sce7726 family protein [Campylobacter mucosalis]QCD44936.1 hypothetical protein CMUC_1162 [Campylobacter mucosalis CCUG 21559]